MAVLNGRFAPSGESILKLILNSAWVAFVITLGKISLGFLSAFALIYFSLPYKKIYFFLILPH